MTPLHIPMWINIWTYGDEKQATCHDNIMDAIEELALHIFEDSPGAYLASWTNDKMWVGAGMGQSDLTPDARNMIADWEGQSQDMKLEMMK